MAAAMPGNMGSVLEMWSNIFKGMKELSKGMSFIFSQPPLFHFYAFFQHCGHTWSLSCGL